MSHQPLARGAGDSLRGVRAGTRRVSVGGDGSPIVRPTAEEDRAFLDKLALEMIQAPIPDFSRSPSGVRIWREPVFAAPHGYRPLALDLYLPPGSLTPPPVVVYVHGGAWLFGHRAQLQEVLADLDIFGQLPLRGIGVASIDYRLCREAVFPAQLHDVKAAVRWLRARAGELHIDPERIGAWGDSAGGHLVSLVGLTAGAGPELEGNLGLTGVSSSVQAVVDWYGPSDLIAMYEQTRGDDAAEGDASEPADLLIGARVVEEPESARRASPSTYVHRGTPPFLIMHGTRDAQVPFEQSVQLHEELANAGVDCTFLPVEGADHVLSTYQDRAGLLSPVLAFLTRVLGA